MRIRIQFVRSIFTLAAFMAGMALAQNDWPDYGRDPGAQRYSPLTQINAGNVQQLIQAWTYETRPAPSEAKARESKTTPLMVNNVLYFATPYQSLVAVEPETGKRIWTFDHQHAARTSRGIAYWPGNRNAPPTIFFGTEDGFLIAVNAKTGKLVPGFAREGELDLKPGMKAPELDNAPYGLKGLRRFTRTSCSPGLICRTTALMAGAAMCAPGTPRPESWSGPSTQFRSRENPAMKPGSTKAGKIELA
jgi:glucose dehydrogenase